MATAAISTVAHNGGPYADVPGRIQARLERIIAMMTLADHMVEAGLRCVGGSYCDVTPVGDRPGQRLPTLTNYYNRFPLTDEDLTQPSITVAVNTAPTDDWGREAALLVEADCSRTANADDWSGYGIYTCPSEVLVTTR